MRRHAKASSAGSNPSQGSSLGSLLRGAFATRGASGDSKGSGAPISRLSSRLLLLCLATAAALAAFVSPALAITIDSTYVSAVTSKEATLHATINPEGLATTYHFDYGTDTSYGTSTPENGAGSDSSVHSVARSIGGLAPNTVYHYRVVTTNTAETLPGPDRTFTTYSPGAGNTSCPNQAFRIGAGANLPDCRAYEMVSPVDKNGGDVAPFWAPDETVPAALSPRAAYNQAAVDGSKMTYTSGTPFGDVISGRNSNQYIATRGAAGWSTHAINAPVTDHIIGEPFNIVYPLATAFRLFTPDLSKAWIQDASLPTLLPGASLGVPDLYLRDNLTESYKALTTQEPPVVPEEAEYHYRLRGHSSDFSEVLFDTRAPLTTDAFPTNSATFQTYASASDSGQLRLVSVRPDGSANKTQSQGNAMSDDGSRAFWTAGDAQGGLASIKGAVYLRENPVQPQSAQALGSATGFGNLVTGSNEVTGVGTSTGAFAVGQTIVGFVGEIGGQGGVGSVRGLPFGTTITAVNPGSLTLSANATQSIPGVTLLASSECTEPDKACTVPISESVPGVDYSAEFDLASADGSKLLFNFTDTVDGSKNLYEFDVETQTPTSIAGKVMGTVGGSRDASRVYFLSKEDLAPGATAGEPNLYLREGGTETFVATLALTDAGAGEATFQPGLTNIVGREKTRGNRVSPDGRHLVFMSESKALSEATAGYDNTDAVSGKPDREVYLYEAGGELLCISCNPSGARPLGRLLDKSFSIPGNVLKTSVWAAAWIPGWEHQSLAQRLLADDGSRVFFNSYDALVPGDTNGAQDVYQWERPGSGDCIEASSSFSERNGGCLTLISSGQSPQLSEFIDATPNGDDVFFSTGSSLIRPDPGLLDVYDARVGGGFDYPTTSPGCEGETCQGTPVPLNDATPASASYNGPGNVKEAAKKKKSKKKHKQKKKAKKQKKKGAKKSKRAGHSTHRKG